MIRKDMVTPIDIYTQKLKVEEFTVKVWRTDKHWCLEYEKNLLEFPTKEALVILLKSLYRNTHKKKICFVMHDVDCNLLYRDFTGVLQFECKENRVAKRFNNRKRTLRTPVAATHKIDPRIFERNY